MSAGLGDLIGGDFDSLFGGVEAQRELPKLRKAYDDLRARCLTAEGKLARIDALISDPGESHRMITRLEIGRILRG